jgi:hypothetical protein
MPLSTVTLNLVGGNDVDGEARRQAHVRQRARETQERIDELARRG